MPALRENSLGLIDRQMGRALAMSAGAVAMNTIETTTSATPLCRPRGLSPVVSIGVVDLRDVGGVEVWAAPNVAQAVPPLP